MAKATSNRMRADKGSLGRKVGDLKPKRTFVVFCEGARTEPIYLNALRRLGSKTSVVDLKVISGTGDSAPLNLVSKAVKLAERNDCEIDEIWCVFDVDDHKTINQAIKLAKDNNIELAISNPCFELWLILHFCDHRSTLNCSKASNIRMVFDNSKGKEVNPNLYLPRLATAIKHSERLDQMYDQNGSELPNNNPSSGMYRLVSRL
ncbi:unnamed protein product [Acidithrix sp. C25]|nr:unnamed protein product [Acidithrix sp. C25]